MTYPNLFELLKVFSNIIFEQPQKKEPKVYDGILVTKQPSRRSKPALSQKLRNDKPVTAKATVDRAPKATNKAAK